MYYFEPSWLFSWSFESEMEWLVTCIPEREKKLLSVTS